MQATIVMTLALSGLGCHNMDSQVIQSSTTASCQAGPSNAYVYSNTVAPSCHPAYAGSHSGGYDSSGYSGGSLRSTLWSFILGRDPEVPTVREIEESFYSGRYNQSYPGGYMR